MNTENDGKNARKNLIAIVTSAAIVGGALFIVPAFVGGAVSNLPQAQAAVVRFSLLGAAAVAFVGFRNAFR